MPGALGRATGRDRPHDLDLLALAVRAQIEHVHEVALGAIRALAVRLVDDEHVGDLEQARLDRLDVVAEARAP